MKKVAIIIGSTRPSRRSPEVAKWLKSQLDISRSIQFELIDLQQNKATFSK
ncbi:NAD(P)H-dependent oxidoreductase [Lactobacillus crispatus]|jgi:NAD(P)H-dependent FMN reductase|uniref:NAD(P)H-dependent oxidoreductase n=1 Tax=Lactobacillaceae TaxID=33958 RepID=UPI0012391C68|nr:NAD(P)H-dependent oxidoreductase [Limosilactobacillus oris]KAA8807365.1 NAD(P)H-dependent oxidoreductase [Lactobacillus crispatus]